VTVVAVPLPTWKVMEPLRISALAAPAAVAVPLKLAEVGALPTQPNRRYDARVGQFPGLRPGRSARANGGTAPAVEAVVNWRSAQARVVDRVDHALRRVA